MKNIFPIARTSLALVCVLALTACRTIQYREVQSDFQRAVEAETARAESPFVDWYEGVAGTLTDDYIGKLNEKLRPNAWMLRGLSEWRSGSYSNATVSASKGTAEIERQKATAPNVSSSRDGIVLTLLPGLVQDSRLRDRLQTLGTNELMFVTYQTNFLPQFKSVLQQFAEARRSFAAPTPSAVKLYWNYQLWRVLENWNITLGKVEPFTPNATRALTEADAVIATQFPKLTGGTNLTSAIQASKLSIPEGHPYRRLIEFEEKR